MQGKIDAWLVAARKAFAPGPFDLSLWKLTEAEESSGGGGRRAADDAFVVKSSPSGVVFLAQFLDRKQIVWHRKLRQELLEDPQPAISTNLIQQATRLHTGCDLPLPSGLQSLVRELDLLLAADVLGVGGLRRCAISLLEADVKHEWPLVLRGLSERFNEERYVPVQEFSSDSNLANFFGVRIGKRQREPRPAFQSALADLPEELALVEQYLSTQANVDALSEGYAKWSVRADSATVLRVYHDWLIRSNKVTVASDNIGQPRVSILYKPPKAVSGEQCQEVFAAEVAKALDEAQQHLSWRLRKVDVRQDRPPGVDESMLHVLPLSLELLSIRQLITAVLVPTIRSMDMAFLDHVCRPAPLSEWFLDELINLEQNHADQVDEIIQGRIPGRAQQPQQPLNPAQIVQYRLGLETASCQRLLALMARELHTRLSGFLSDDRVRLRASREGLEQTIRSSPLLQPLLIDIGPERVPATDLAHGVLSSYSHSYVVLEELLDQCVVAVWRPSEPRPPRQLPPGVRVPGPRQREELSVEKVRSDYLERILSRELVTEQSLQPRPREDTLHLERRASQVWLGVLRLRNYLFKHLAGQDRRQRLVDTINLLWIQHRGQQAGAPNYYDEETKRKERALDEERGAMAAMEPVFEL